MYFIEGIISCYFYTFTIISKYYGNQGSFTKSP